MSKLIKSILAGIAIALAGTAYLSVDNSVIGSLLFTLGLLSIYLFDWNLFTGKACYILSNPPAFLKVVGIAFIGNLIGTFLTAAIFHFTKLKHLIPKAQELVEGKLSYSLLNGFIMGIGCGFLLYVAVIGYKTKKSDFEKTLLLILPVMAFILIGFEHSIANMFYITMARAWTIDSALYILCVAAGNLIGCCFIPFLHKHVKND